MAELGPDTELFGTPKRLISWAGVAPGNNESAGKRSGDAPRQSMGSIDLDGSGLIGIS